MFGLIFLTGASAQFLSTGASWVPQQSWQPSYSNWQPNSYTTLQSTASTSAFVAQPSYNVGSSYTPMTSAASTGAYVQQPYIQQASISSENNPYNVKALGVGKLIGRTATKNMGVAQQMMIGEQHVVGNDLKVLENHEADKTIFTKKVVHHSPVLHKTIRTHEIAEDTVHDKLVHHMNTVKDQFRKVPGNSYQGAVQHVDETTPVAPFPKIQAQNTEQHIVGKDLKVLENHESDKVIFTKKVVHHSPVLHKTIRTHEIAEDTVHDKLVHHMNTVKDQFRKVPGNNYMGGEQHVDHTTAIEAAPRVVAQEIAQPQFSIPRFSKFTTGCLTGNC